MHEETEDRTDQPSGNSIFVGDPSDHQEKVIEHAPGPEPERTGLSKDDIVKIRLRSTDKELKEVEERIRKEGTLAEHEMLEANKGNTSNPAPKEASGHLTTGILDGPHQTETECNHFAEVNPEGEKERDKGEVKKDEDDLEKNTQKDAENDNKEGKETQEGKLPSTNKGATDKRSGEKAGVKGTSEPDLEKKVKK